MNLIVEREKVFLSDKIQSIDEVRFKLSKEYNLWLNTRENLLNEESFSGISNRIDEMIDYLDDVKTKIKQKSDKLLLMLDRTSELSFSLSEQIGTIEKTLITNESKIFSRHYKTLFEINWKDSSSWSLSGTLTKSNREEAKSMVNYLLLNISRLIFLLITILGLIVIFRALKKQIIDNAITKDTFLGIQIRKIFNRPLLIALVLGLFSSVLILPNRPELFGDITQILVAFPLIYIVYLLLDKKFSRQLILFGVLLVSQTSIYIFPPDHLLYRMIIFIIVFAELGLLWSLTKYVKKSPMTNVLVNNVLMGLLFVNVIIVFIGFIGAIMGATLLAEEAVNFPLFSVFAAMLLFVSAVSISGLIEIGIESPGARYLSIIKINGKVIKTRLVRIINTGAVIYWIIVLLRSIRLDRIVIDALSKFIKNDVHIGSANFSFGDILTFIIVIYLSVLLSRFLQVILEKDILSKFNLKKGIPYTVGLMARYTVITLGIFLAVTAAGLPVGSLGILIGAMGVGIGFGLQNIFNNLVSGLILLFERPIQIGDTIKVGELTGNVKSIGIRSSNVRTFDGAEVIVPNGQFISNEVINWTLSDHQRRIEVIAGVAYGSDPHLVKKILIEGLEKHPDILDDPSPNVYFNDLGESSLDFRILFWTANIGEWLRIRSEVVFMVHDELKKNGIVIPFPQRDLHIKSIKEGIEAKDVTKK